MVQNFNLFYGIFIQLTWLSFVCIVHPNFRSILFLVRIFHVSSLSLCMWLISPPLCVIHPVAKKKKGTEESSAHTDTILTPH
jgi:hypothetical protein